MNLEYVCVWGGGGGVTRELIAEKVVSGWPRTAPSYSFKHGGNLSRACHVLQHETDHRN